MWTHIIIHTCSMSASLRPRLHFTWLDLTRFDSIWLHSMCIALRCAVLNWSRCCRLHAKPTTTNVYNNYNENVQFQLTRTMKSKTAKGKMWQTFRAKGEPNTRRKRPCVTKSDRVRETQDQMPICVGLYMDASLLQLRSTCFSLLLVVTKSMLLEALVASR